MMAEARKKIPDERIYVELYLIVAGEAPVIA